MGETEGTLEDDVRCGMGCSGDEIARWGDVGGTRLERGRRIRRPINEAKMQGRCGRDIG